MDSPHEQLRRVLQLALHSPYEGERAKAVALLVQRMEREGVDLPDLDPSFRVADAENELRRRANLPYTFEVTLKSHEEALLFQGLLEQASASATLIESHRLRCVASPAAKAATEVQFEQQVLLLQRRLAEAQKQAMAEYQVRRRMLFMEVVEEVISSVAQKTGKI
ncbi:hypothetical protein [Deinococcus sp. NW-56]|uniref:hypothetical protein n=1 Tax=Deinococcus sp. NW-56 TaxID=2080419 RepID=UPI00131A1404|nr:hypothetical protein [Deinococcus sp. NW-56]